MNTSGNGVFDGKLDEVVVVISQVDGPAPSTVAVDLDFIAFTKGKPLPTAVAETFSDSRKPESFYLSSAYPNPFNPSTTIKYDLSREADVRLEVFNVVGQKVRTIIEQNQQAGSYRVNVVADDLPSGLYLYRLQAGIFLQVRKMILMK